MENVKEIIGDDDVTIIYSKWEEGKSLINHKHKRSQMKMMMSPIVRSLSFLVAYSSLFILGFCNDDDSSSSKHAVAAESESQTQRSSGSFTMIMLITVFIALVVFSLLSFLLFKLWRKKKREEQYALLLKLFEEDDELELELGLKD
ncbi:uncharacterized protein LOC123910769 [Trifolium pratense]|uniref:uncharacterized protein LOC123910769 n=1 Tax=Trifolium pratense TaxID=57577 RepID=UPI001E697F1F|nr:uncharacterized protein LOC123910769 [Trifolium pratense]